MVFRPGGRQPTIKWSHSDLVTKTSVFKEKQLLYVVNPTAHHYIGYENCFDHNNF